MNKSSRRGVSPVIATTIILAITIALGLALWSFANSGIGAATTSYANVITNYGEFTKDNFVIASIAFNNPSSNHIAVWLYNSGDFATNISNIVVTCKDCKSFTVVNKSAADFDATSINPISRKDLGKLSIDTGQLLETGKTYEVKIISQTGAIQESFQKN